MTAGNYTEDIDGQVADNYSYDQIGNLTGDIKEKIDSIEWNVYGKIAQIWKDNSAAVGDLQRIAYRYDASGNRISKTVYSNQDATNYKAVHTWYVRDASGNVMATYTSEDVVSKSTLATGTLGKLYLSELHMYGSSRLGIWNRKLDMDVLPGSGGEAPLLGTLGIDTFNRGNKFFELANHLGNVLVSVSDRKVGQNPVSGLYTSYTADVVSASDYAPFGMQMVGRTFSAGSYRYGFNGKEKDPETSGEGNQYDYGFRIYNPRLGRFLSVDPLTVNYPYYTPYQFAGNKPIVKLDLDGREDMDYTFFTKTQKEGRVLLIPPYATQVVKNKNAPFNITYKIDIDGKVFTANSIQTLNGRDDKTSGAGDFTRIQELNRQDLVNIIGYSTFVIERLYNGNVEEAMLSESNAGPFKNGRSLLDFKNRLYDIFGLNNLDLIAIDGIAYNANEAGNYIWSFVLNQKATLLEPESIAEIGSNIQGRNDEPNEKKSIRAGERKSLAFRLSDEEKKFVNDIFMRYMEDYDYFYEDEQNETKAYRPSNILGGLKSIREKEGQQPTLPKEPYLPKR